MQLSGWMEEQEANNEKKWKEFAAQQCHFWTTGKASNSSTSSRTIDVPAADTTNAIQNFEDHYCVKWLADGAEVPHHDPGRSGCSGGCGKAHPRVTLDWHKNSTTTTTATSSSTVSANASEGGATEQPGSSSGQAKRKQPLQEEKQERDEEEPQEYVTATLSHEELLPFRNYFDNLCDRGLAARVSNKNKKGTAIGAIIMPATATTMYHYRFKGSLPISTHMQQIREQAPFGSHLIKVASHEAMVASEQAHRQYLLQQQEALEIYASQTRRRLTMNRNHGDNGGGMDLLLEQVLEVCYNHNLQDHLDLAEMAWMRCTCKFMARIANQMILQQMQQLRLVYSVLTDGMYCDTTTLEGQTDPHPPEAFISIPNMMTRRFVDLYSVQASHVPLQLSNIAQAADGEDANSIHNHHLQSTFQYSPVATATNLYPWQSPWLSLQQEQAQHSFTFYSPHSHYKGHLVRLYLLPADSSSSMSCGGSLLEGGCLFANSKVLEVARYPVHPQGLRQGVHLDATSSSCLRYEAITADEETRSATTIDGDDSNTTVDHKLVRYSGTMRLESIPFGFGDLLGIYVRKKLPLAKQRLLEIRSKRPATTSEKEYVKALAKAVRQSPGNAHAFRGMMGWGR